MGRSYIKLPLEWTTTVREKNSTTELFFFELLMLLIDMLLINAFFIFNMTGCFLQLSHNIFDVR